uniref:DUF4780 domain-containing protein n=1 Tax=Cacopsylla melanoneura TaxID=428564 RepID=A0A8D9A7T3_9HEMI
MARGSLPSRNYVNSRYRMTSSLKFSCCGEYWGSAAADFCLQVINPMSELINQTNEDTAPQSAVDSTDMQNLEKELQALEKDLTNSSQQMEVESNEPHAQEPLSPTEATKKPQQREKFQSLSGAARKRFKWLLKQGLGVTEARAKALEKLPDETRTSKKRGRSEDSTPEAAKGEKLTEQKRQKVLIPSQKPSSEGHEGVPETSQAPHSFANALKSTKVGVLLQNYPEDNLTNDQMANIQSQILDKIAEKEGAPYPQFSGTAYRPGWLSITCDNSATVDWLKSIIGGIQPSTGANLKVVDEGDLPKSKILSGYFPSSSEEATEKILRLVKAQNQSLTSNEWKVLRRNNEGTAAHLIMSVDLASVELLKKENYKISYKFGKVALHNKSEPKPQPNVQPPAKANVTSGVEPVKANPKPSGSRTNTGVRSPRPGKGKRDWKPRKPRS